MIALLTAGVVLTVVGAIQSETFNGVDMLAWVLLAAGAWAAVRRASKAVR
jgi:hypothetical protein